MIKFENVYLQYIKEFHTLYNFSCEITSHTLFVGDFYDGTNSIMRLLAKVDSEYTGDIFIDDVDIKHIKNKDLPIAYLPENPVLFKNITIFKNLYFPFKLRKVPKDIATKQINEFLATVTKQYPDYNLAEKLNTQIKKLSLSEQKIISLIRSAIRMPKYILLQNFFDNLEEKHFEIAVSILNIIKKDSLVIACEKNKDFIRLFNNFEIVNLTNTNI